MSGLRSWSRTSRSRLRKIYQRLSLGTQRLGLGSQRIDLAIISVIYLAVRVVF